MVAKINADNNHPSVHSLTSQYLINLRMGPCNSRVGPTCRVQCAISGRQEPNRRHTGSGWVCKSKSFVDSEGN